MAIYSFGELDISTFYYFSELYILLELTGFLLKKYRVVDSIKTAYIFLLIYIVVNSITLALFPEWENLIFNRLGHLISGVIFTSIAFEISRVAFSELNRSNSIPLIFVFALAQTCGVFVEIIELFLDVTTGSKRIGPGFDTAIDLLMNTLGITLFLILKRSFSVRIK